MSFDVVCDEIDDCACNVGLLQLSDKCVYVYCVENFVYIECYSDCSLRCYLMCVICLLHRTLHTKFSLGKSIVRVLCIDIYI